MKNKCLSVTRKHNCVGLCEAGRRHKQGVCGCPLSFVCEAGVQQGLTAWAFKDIRFAGTKQVHSIMRTLTTSLMSQYIQLLSHQLLWRACSLLCSGASGTKRSGICPDCENIYIDSSTVLFLRADHSMSTLYPLDHGGSYLVLFMLQRLLCCSFISGP